MTTLYLNKILALATIGSQAFIVAGTVYAILMRKRNDPIIQFFVKNTLAFTFIILLAATLGSLLYSNIVGFEPCYLCWYQRIFTFPSVILLAMAMVKKDRGILDYVLGLTFIGTLISIYHNFISYGGSDFIPCPATGASCTKLYVYEFGYVTIPMMMLTTFALVIFLILLHRKFSV
jgi:disulfide bond formation protein DsbB